MEKTNGAILWPMMKIVKIEDVLHNFIEIYGEGYKEVAARAGGSNDEILIDDYDYIPKRKRYSLN